MPVWATSRVEGGAPVILPCTVRKDFGTDVEKNAAHGSDAPETAAQEIAFFFRGTDFA